ELLPVLLNKSVTVEERKLIVNALKKCSVEPDWINISEQLSNLGDIDSLYVVLEVFSVAAESFEPVKIATIFHEIIKQSIIDNQISVIGLGYEVFNTLSLEQLEGCLNNFLNYINTTTDNNKKYQYKMRDLVLKFVQERLRRNPAPEPQSLWTWLDFIGEGSSHNLNQDDQIHAFLSKNMDYRRAVQTIAFATTEKLEQLWLILCTGYKGLWLNESDIIFHLNNILTLQIPDADLRWKELVRWIFANQSFTGTAKDYAQKQSENNTHLFAHYKEIEKRYLLAKEEMKKFEREQLQQKAKHQHKTLIRHKQYEEIRQYLNSGEHLNALYQVSMAYLGWFSDITGETPQERVAELIGSELVHLALDGILSAIDKQKIPTVHEMINLRINSKQISPFEAILVVYCDILLSRGEKLDKLPLDLACSALLSCQQATYLKTKDQIADVQKQLELIVFKDKTSRENFIKATIEPYLNCNEQYIPGLSRIETDVLFTDIAGKLALTWLEKYENLSDNNLRVILNIAICHAQEKIIELIRYRINELRITKDSQWEVWLSAGFLLDFEYHFELLNQQASEHKALIWPFGNMMFADELLSSYWPQVSEHQLYFFISKFAPVWEPVPYPSGSFLGTENPWDATALIKRRINHLASIATSEAQQSLIKLINNTELKGYQCELKHALAQNIRLISESNKKVYSLESIRNILSNREPANHEDLQALIIDELEMLQLRIKNSQTSDFEFYWNGDNPHIENYCRNQLVSALIPYLERYKVRSHIEGVRSDDKRCDLLNTYNLLDVPIEIKGQWHPDIWTAAENQLQDYSQDYHSDGYGIYLVLWFGDCKSKMPKSRNSKKPKTYQEMVDMLSENYKTLSKKTRIFVLDLSK
ncbi:TPA: hypothetical protein U6304_003027, partial [Legionella pneumophila]|nr:hypothetical protein [Legionella pneumophila]